jgi:hypothetical protein
MLSPCNEKVYTNLLNFTEAKKQIHQETKDMLVNASKTNFHYQKNDRSVQPPKPLVATWKMAMYGD